MKSESLEVLKEVVKYNTFVISVKNEGSVGRNAKEIEKYFEKGPEIQTVVKKHVEYNVFVKVGSKGPRHEWLARSDFKGNSEGLKVLKEAVKYTIFVIFVKNEGSIEENREKSREPESNQKAYKLHQFRQGWVGETSEKH